MFSHLCVSFSALSPLLAYSFKLALCIAHTRPLPDEKEKKSKREQQQRVCVCVSSPLLVIETLL